MESFAMRMRNQTDLVLVFAVTGILSVLFLPIPSGLLDFLLITNFSFAFLILLLTFYVKKPLEFSTFPSLLLIATLFRLALNISATRLILSDADAGRVIQSIGEHVVGGNYVIGMIVFIVLIVVQYVVVTNGAQRVAEVAARFTLDSMPGKQMSIDADMNIGLIDENEARERRRQIEREGNFYGAMDGASKFVKGDAIAGIIIVLIDIIGGLTIGIAQLGMNWGEALRTYTLLTVGDGIVTQIPALVIATGTGIIVTRAASDTYLSAEISRQITSYPKILGILSCALFVTLFIPGIPAFPVLMLLGVVGTLAWVARRAGSMDADIEEAAETETSKAADESEDIYDLLTVDAIELQVGQALISLVGGEDSLLMERVKAFRKQFAMEMGVVMQPLRVKDDRTLGAHAYQLNLFGAKLAEAEILPDRHLAIDPGNAKSKLEGLETTDPAYGLPAVWVLESERDRARAAGYTVVEPLTVLMTHITGVLRRHVSKLLTRSVVEKLVEGVRKRNTGLVDELVPSVMTYSEIQKVLQGLLDENVPIRNLDLILEVLIDEGTKTKDPNLVTELVRKKLAASICEPLMNSSGELHVLVLDPEVERTLAAGVTVNERGGSLAVDPKFAEQLITQTATHVQKMLTGDILPVLLCAPELRRHVRQLMERMIPQLNVISLEEIPNTVNVKSYGMVAL
ncbi:flagellar biosynthesis protein FlhA [Myxococcota bacterium]|nr:flagellar biosynthesis protein FlhA [Myxococcota bacterium]